MAAGEAVFESTLGLDALPWLAHHRVAGRALVPGAAIAELVRAAATHARHAGAAVEGLVLRSPMALPDVGALRVQVVLTRDAGGAHIAAVYSQPARAESAAPWTLHATATVSTEDAAAPARADLDALRARCADAVDVDETYARLAAAGLDYGAAFRGLRALWRGDGEAVARVAKRAEDASDGYGIHPALLDAALHSVAAVASAETSEGPWLPFEIGRGVGPRAARARGVAARPDGARVAPRRERGRRGRGVGAPFAPRRRGRAAA
jgi:acyl transferase domain-containing protein